MEFAAWSETLLYVKFKPGLEVSLLVINLAGGKVLETVAIYVNIDKYWYVGW